MSALDDALDNVAWGPDHDRPTRREQARAELATLRRKAAALDAVAQMDERHGRSPWWGYQESGVRTFCIACHSDVDHAADCPVPGILAAMEPTP